MMVGEKITSVADLRQGDVVDIGWLPTIEGREARTIQTPGGAVIVSQTCDVVQESSNKKYVTVAPVIRAPDSSLLSLARRGQAPLLLYLESCDSTEEAIADMGRVASIPKTELLKKVLKGRHTDSDSSDGARHLAERIGRVYSRFAFPDPVVEFLDKMKKKARKAAKGNGAFGKVLDHLNFRVCASRWEGKKRDLDLYVIVKPKLLISGEDEDPDWALNRARVIGLKRQEDFTATSLTRISELLAATCESLYSDPKSTDGTTLLKLWESWCDALRRELLAPFLNDEVLNVEVELLNEHEFTYFDVLRTVTLDLEDLSPPGLGEVFLQTGH